MLTANKTARASDSRGFQVMFAPGRLTLGVFFPIEAFKGDQPTMCGQERLALRAEELLPDGETPLRRGQQRRAADLRPLTPVHGPVPCGQKGGQRIRDFQRLLAERLPGRGHQLLGGLDRLRVLPRLLERLDRGQLFLERGLGALRGRRAAVLYRRPGRAARTSPQEGERRDPRRQPASK